MCVSASRAWYSAPAGAPWVKSAWVTACSHSAQAWKYACAVGKGPRSIESVMRPSTALQSMEIASETILTHKVKVMVADGFNNLCKEGSYEFGNMQWLVCILHIGYWLNKVLCHTMYYVWQPLCFFIHTAGCNFGKKKKNQKKTTWVDWKSQPQSGKLRSVRSNPRQVVAYVVDSRLVKLWQHYLRLSKQK